MRAVPGANIDRLSERLEDELRPYGLVSTTPRSEQPGYDALNSELEQNRIMARSLPLLVLELRKVLRHSRAVRQAV